MKHWLLDRVASRKQRRRKVPQKNSIEVKNIQKRSISLHSLSTFFFIPPKWKVPWLGDECICRHVGKLPELKEHMESFMRLQLLFSTTRSETGCPREKLYCPKKMPTLKCLDTGLGFFQTSVPLRALQH